ncbi:NfeD family protein [Thermaerobacillus caldiproteolyticus]|uniref:NfeD family protein n=1 Tax=Thermaerobacillus caldiproteolyticus TaxID=247480 RepID=UPI00188A19AF|nr:NfeD family protein [Anoxybacillus caldiproteolyticus]QPA31265.1 NfeD family protein [Anoxybacillus caldiproteolyticus]
MFGYPMETIYIILLVVSGSLTFVYILLSDMLDGIFDVPDHPLLSPQLILSFLTVFSASGYLFEKYMSMSKGFIGLISAGIAFIIVLLLHFFVFIPLRSAEASLNYSEADLEGRIAKVIVTVPQDGFGEILIQGASGTISKPAKGVKNEEIPSGTEVIIVKMENGFATVAKHDPYYIPLQ